MFCTSLSKKSNNLPTIIIFFHKTPILFLDQKICNKRAQRYASLSIVSLIYLFPQKREEEEAARLKEEEKVSTCNKKISNEDFSFLFYVMKCSTHIFFSPRE